MVGPASLTCKADLFMFSRAALAVAALVFWIPTGSAFSEPASGREPAFSPIEGALDPRTGLFLPKAVETDAARASQSRTGQFNVTVRIALQAAIDPKSPITCYIQFQHSGVAYSQEVGRVRGRRVGNTGICQIAMPYTWAQVDPNVQVRMLYSISAGDYDVRQREASGNRGMALPAPNATTDVVLYIRL